MSFRDRSKPSASSKIVLPITPMLDMTFQLLFFFIVNFRPAPSTIEGAMEMALPSETTTANPDKPAEPNKGDFKIDFKADLTVKVRASQDEATPGEISSLFLMDASGKESPVDGGLPGLKATLKAKRAEMPDGVNKANIKVQAGGKLRVKNLMTVMDACSQAGFTNVSMIPPEDFTGR